LTVDTARFLELFRGRPDVFASQQRNGSYYPVTRPLTTDEVDEHLDGMASYGTYVITPGENTVTYIVFDLDVLDEEAADTLCSLVEHMCLSNGETHVPAGYTQCLMREFSGNKGTHVWLFLDVPVPAEKVRRWVAADFMPQWREAATAKGWPVAIEVFPKQDTVPDNGFGNLIKLPLGVHAVSGARSEIVAHQGWANSVDEIRPLPSSLVPDRERVAPERGARASTGQRRERGGNGGPASPFPCIDTIMREGVGSGNRDNAMFHLALYCYGHGLDEDLALEICNRANENFDPPMGQGEVDHKVHSAYSGRYESSGCGAGWLAEVCPGPCNVGWRVRRAEPVESALRSSSEGSPVEVAVVRNTSDGRTRRITVAHPDADNTPTFIVNH